MKKIFVSFSALFLVLYALPVFATIEEDCVNIANQVVDCIFDETITRSPGALEKQCKYQNSLSHKATYSEAARKLATLIDARQIDMYEEKFKKARTKAQKNKKEEIIAAAKAKCVSYKQSIVNQATVSTSGVTESNAANAQKNEQTVAATTTVAPVETGSVGPAYADDDTQVGPIAKINTNVAAQTNDQYAERLKDPNSWVEAEAQDPIASVSTNAYAEFTEDTPAPRETIASLATPVEAPAAVKPSDIQIKANTRELSKSDLEKSKKLQDETTCDSKNGRWDGVNCWCDTTAKKIDLANGPDCPTKDEKEQINTDNQAKCKDKKGTWNNTLKKCYCGVKEQSLDSNAEICTKGQEKEDNVAEKAACEAAKESGAKWSINKCECTDKTKNWSKEDKTCVQKAGDCKINNGKGKYDAKGVCKVVSCNDKYVKNNDETKCELETTANIRNKNQQNKNDKAFADDVDKFITAFKTVSKKIYEKEKATAEQQGAVK